MGSFILNSAKRREEPNNGGEPTKRFEFEQRIRKK